MSEQLWYTWSASGLGNTHGFRVRAASAKLMDVEGQRVRALINLARYTLSSDTDLFLPPPEAPLCLAFLKASAKQESILIQKTYTGLDGVRRPGAFFSHLITELPQVPSQHPSGQVPFSAREAIALWRSKDLWHNSEEGWPTGKRELESIPSTDLYGGKYAGPLNEQAVVQTGDIFRLAIEAFLTLALSGEHKRLYLAGTPDTVATLIWGITHALPRTLTIMRDMTFSTFEANIESDTKPLIVGTCWLPLHLKKGHENALLDLPARYYQANNPYGLAINCDTAQYTPFTAHPLVTQYIQFVLDCFKEGNTGMTKLMMLLDKAEKRNISSIMDFLNHYTGSHETINKDDMMHLLNKLHHKVEASMVKAKTTLQQDTLPAAAAEAAQIGDIQSETEAFKQDNVQQSLMLLIKQDPIWWQSQGQDIIGRLCKLAAHYTDDQLTKMSKSFIHKIISSKQWQKNQRADAIGAIQRFVQDTSHSGTPQDILSAFAQSITQRVLETQKELRSALFPLTKSIADQLIKAMLADQYQPTAFWNGAFAICVDLPEVPIEVWAYLLQQLATASCHTDAYKQWWEQYCKQRLAKLRSQTSSNPASSLDSAFSSFTHTAAIELVVAIRENKSTELLFWDDILDTLATPRSEPNVWVFLLNQLEAIPSNNPTYEQWWKTYGKTRQGDLLALASTNSELNKALSFLIPQKVSLLEVAIRNGDTATLSLYKDMFSGLASDSVWMDLLLNLRDALTTPGFFQWWNEQGNTIADDLRRRAEKNEGKLAEQLSTFAQAVAKQLSLYIIAEVQQNQGQYKIAIDFLFKVFSAAVPTQDSTARHTLLNQLTYTEPPAYVYKTASWEHRSALLQHWKPLTTLKDNNVQTVLRLWCEVSWDDLDAFLSLSLPDAWYATAITKALDTTSLVSSDKVLDTVRLHKLLFEKTLEELIKVHLTQSRAITFFGFLADNNYEQVLPLLDHLLCASDYQKDLAETLLQVAHITSDKDIVTLLEQHCKELLAKYELPSTMLGLIERYFDHFDVEYLDADPTKALLLRLQQRAKLPLQPLPAEIQQSVKSWYKTSEFLVQPQVSYNALRDLGHSLAQLSPDMRKKLTTKLIPYLVERVTSEGTLTLILHVIGRESELQLLYDMAEATSDKYGKDRPPVRIAPYVRKILEESNQLQSPKKEKFIDTCLQLLFKDIDTTTRDKYFPELLWPNAFVDEWNKAASRLRSKDLNKALTGFRMAITTSVIPAIINASNPDFEPHLNPEERKIVELALGFDTAYKAGDDMALLQAHQALRQYCTSSPRYTQDQVERLQLARQRQQQFSGPQPAVNTPHPASQSGRNITNPFFPLVNTLKPASAPALVTRQLTAAVMKDAFVSIKLLDLTQELKRSYESYRMTQLQKNMQYIEGSGTSHDKKTLKTKKKQVEEISKLINDVMRLREAALNDLIDDILIQNEIKGLRTNYSEWVMQFESNVTKGIDRLYEELLRYPRDADSPLNATEPKKIEGVCKVLGVFIRHVHFNNYLKDYQQTTLRDWLKEQREKEKANIIIHYEAARIHPPQRRKILGIEF